jgi:uncharacterized protein YhfF
MYERSKFLVPGCTKPLDSDLETFYDNARRECVSADLADDFSVRWIGVDDTTTASILEHVRRGDKTGSVTVPQVVEYNGQDQSRVGDAVVLITFDGTPAVLVRITHVDVVAFGDVKEQHTALDGPGVRAIDIWKPLHEGYFNMLLAPQELVCDATTPIACETFELLYST